MASYKVRHKTVVGWKESFYICFIKCARVYVCLCTLGVAFVPLNGHLCWPDRCLQSLGSARLLRLGKKEFRSLHIEQHHAIHTQTHTQVIVCGGPR